MKKLLVLAFTFFSGLALADWDTSTSTPAIPLVCINNTTPYNVQVFVNRSPMYVAARWTTSVRVYDFQTVVTEINTKQIVNRGYPAWSAKYLAPSVYGCNRANTSVIGMTNYGHLFFY